LIREDISIHIIQSRDHILNTFDSKISDYAEKRFDRDHVNVITNARVEHIGDDEVVYKSKTDGSINKLPYGLCLWSTGIGKSIFESFGS
jgi:NADH dehydrogenase